MATNVPCVANVAVLEWERFSETAFCFLLYFNFYLSPCNGSNTVLGVVFSLFSKEYHIFYYSFLIHSIPSQLPATLI